MPLDIGLIVIGLVCLGGGGELLVRGAVGLALGFRVTPAVIGLTVVAAGTSMPELVVSIIAAFQGSPDIAVANVVGSNIFNIGLALGLTAMLIALPVESSTIRIEWPFLFVITALSMLVMANGIIGRVEGLSMIVLLAVFTWVMVRRSRLDVGAEDPDLESAGGTGLSTLFLALGIGLLVGGGKLVVQGATGIALRAGLSERLVGLTIVAMGTSLPEVASSLVAAYRGRTDVAVGNIVGSCIFNLLGILGVGAVMVPLKVNPIINGFDAWWMLGFTGLLAPLIYFGRRRVSRLDGAVLAGAFAVYMMVLVTRS